MKFDRKLRFYTMLRSVPIASPWATFEEEGGGSASKRLNKSKPIDKKY